MQTNSNVYPILFQNFVYIKINNTNTTYLTSNIKNI